ncbi:glutamine synthetase [Sphingopyxis bauzanensis]|uniref:Glutamine synthetase n=1 Tax=Sphingopyxis bauzanensis TaxID=651663 RepID=A0A246JV11_9SPHN|nr:MULTISPECIES: glutamine synthetase family protein [Sphingopyxis]MBW8294732.1 glutamine synthetase family protein [Sphingopyxis sp.]MDP3782204.1 glutamine synthetase family protein [Sphingopyxis sp.]OWQ96899.1 glutamine synthetase [Sphingopyxis bauzanensis]GGJ43168.1 glutamine synthetase [Sphingopyxis bauzanensis]
MSVNLEQWISDHKIDEVECIVPDINGVQRGKVLPAKKFLASVKDKSLRIPGSVFICTIDGHYPEDIDDIWDKDPDKILIADPDTICVAPGFKSPTAFVIADVLNRDGSEVDIAPRTILKKVLALYAEKGWRPVIAPEVEFYLVSQNVDPDFPLTPPTGQSGRSESASQPYGLEAMNEYEDIIDHIYDDCELMGLDIDTMIHEMGAAQLEVNFEHGDPLRLADEVFLFKRAVRSVAKQHGVYATFMANPMAGQPGSAMHIHQSVVDAATGKNLFSTANGRDSAMFRSYIAGLVRYMPQIAPLWAPNVNSFRRMRPDSAAPINVQWGEDNRSCGFRVPISEKANRRVENRLPGADSNPYLAIAASLICGYIGVVDRMVPAKSITGSAYNRARTLPRTLEAALDRFSSCKKVRNLLGDDFFEIFFAVKDYELFNYQSVVSSWEREHLLMRV